MFSNPNTNGKDLSFLPYKVSCTTFIILFTVPLSSTNLTASQFNLFKTVSYIFQNLTRKSFRNCWTCEVRKCTNQSFYCLHYHAWQCRWSGVRVESSLLGRASFSDNRDFNQLIWRSCMTHQVLSLHFRHDWASIAKGGCPIELLALTFCPIVTQTKR